MTSDQQEYNSVRYAHQPLMVMRLTSGLFAIGQGFNPFELICTCVPERLAERLEAITNEQRQAYERRQSAPKLKIDDLSFINIGDIL